MGWWGKLVGGAFGFMLGGPLGALAGAALGHGLDKGMARLPGGSGGGEGERERVQLAFFTATFSVLGHVAKADGRVSAEEIRLAEVLMDEMDLDPERRRAAIELFNQGKQADFPLDEVLAQFRKECHRRVTLLRMFMEIQLQAAYADGGLETVEDDLLRHIARQLGFPNFAYQQLRRMIEAERAFASAGAGTGAGERQRRGAGAGPRASGPSLADAYAVLGVERTDSPAAIKKAYRRLLSQHHPDKLVSKGLPEEMMKMAAQKTHEIKQAYEKIRSERGFA